MTNATRRRPCNWLSWFRNMMQERRDWPRGSGEWEWRTKAARKYYWAHRGISPIDWPSMERERTQ